jgi:hypothetical protein
MTTPPDTSPNIYQKVIFGAETTLLAASLSEHMLAGWCVTSLTGCDLGFAVLLHRYPPLQFTPITRQTLG